MFCLSKQKCSYRVMVYHFNTYKSYLVKSSISFAKETCKKIGFSFALVFLVVEKYVS
jgi:hypothetical protein